jgi:YbbR domain-containing protein
LAERARDSTTKTTAPRVQTFGTAAVSARQAFAWFWSRESLLRLALSFVLSVALWLYITGQQDPARAVDFPQPLPIETVNVDPGLSVTTNINSVNVRYRSDSPGSIVTSVNFHPIVSLRGVKPGPPVLLPVQVIADPGLHVMQVSPAHVLVTVDKVESRVIPVSETVLTTVPKGYAQGTISLSPSSIQVQGPRSVVSQIYSASVELDLAGVTSTLVNAYKPVLRSSGGGPISGISRIQINPVQVQVRVPITPLSSQKILPVLVPLSGQVKAGYRVTSITTNPQEIIAKGSTATLAKVANAWTTSVHLAGRKATFTTHLPIQVTSGLSSNTRSAVVTVGIQPIKSG